MWNLHVFLILTIQHLYLVHISGINYDQLLKLGGYK